ncbi:kelch-like protein 41 [Amphiura filiformis]|uniref:kelch-like protein 41 n=1 Tax=Amphiura filiformis TaxID=82378 RepID=UPI003B2231D0
MFTSGFQESDKSEVSVDGCGDSTIFERILEFIYTGQLRLTDDLLPDIIQMASYFQFTHVLTVCERFLQRRFRDKTIDFETVVHVSGAYGPLGNIAEDYIATNFKEFAELPSFNETPLDLLETLLDRNDLTALAQQVTENDVFKAVMNWLKHDWENRKEHADSLLRRVRLGVVPDLDFSEAFTDEIMTVPECRELFEEIVKDQFKMYDGYDVANSEMFRARGVKVLMFFAKVHDKQIQAKYFNSRHLTWQPIKGICYWPGLFTKPEYNSSRYDQPDPGPKNIDQVFSDGSRLYINIDMKPEFKHFFSFNSFTANWNVKHYMDGQLKESTWVNLGSCVYAVGGRKSKIHPWSNKVIRFTPDPTPGFWASLPPMPIPDDCIEIKQPPVAVGFQGKLLVYTTLKKVSDGALRRVIFVCFPGNNTQDSHWSCHPIRIFPGKGDQEVRLVTDGKKCYRVCYTPNMYEGTPLVNELIFNFKKTPSVVEIGKAHDQRRIPENGIGAFCLGRQIYVNLNGYIHKLGVSVSKDKDDEEELKKLLDALEEGTHPSGDNEPYFVEHHFTKYGIKVGLPVK